MLAAPAISASALLILLATGSGPVQPSPDPAALLRRASLGARALPAPSLQAPDGSILLATPAGLLRGEASAVTDGGLGRVGPRGRVAALTIDARDGRILAFVDGRVWESRDSGRTFDESDVQLPDGVVPVALALSGERVVAAAADGGLLLLEERSWRHVAVDAPPALGGRSSAVLAAVSIGPADPSLLVAVSEDIVVLRSSDGGSSWDEPVSGAGLPQPWRTGRPILRPAGPALPSTLYLAKARASSSTTVHWHLYRSDDAGASWRPVGKRLALSEPVAWLSVAPGRPEVLEVGTAAGVHLVDTAVGGGR